MQAVEQLQDNDRERRLFSQSIRDSRNSTRSRDVMNSSRVDDAVLFDVTDFATVQTMFHSVSLGRRWSSSPPAPYQAEFDGVFYGFQFISVIPVLWIVSLTIPARTLHKGSGRYREFNGERADVAFISLWRKENSVIDRRGWSRGL